MAQRIINQYGVIEPTTVGDAVRSAQRTVRTAIKEVTENYRLSPEEMLLFEHHVMSEVSATFAEQILRKALAMRKELNTGGSYSGA